jgi:hypothetical protein
MSHTLAYDFKVLYFTPPEGRLNDMSRDFRPFAKPSLVVNKKKKKPAMGHLQYEHDINFPSSSASHQATQASIYSFPALAPPLKQSTSIHPPS